MQLLDSVRGDLRQAWRALRGRPGFALVAVATLALGIGAPTAVFSAVEGVLLRPLPYAQADRIVHIGERPLAQPGPGGTTSYDNFADWQRLTGSFSAMGIVATTAPTLTGQGEPVRVPIALVSSGMFDVFGVRPFLGRGIAPADGAEGAAPVLVLSYAFWRARFGGDPGIVGRSVLLDSSPTRVVGVLPPGFVGTGRMDRPVWSNFVNDTADGRAGRSKEVYARLRPGVSLAAAQAELLRVTAELQRRYPEADRGEIAVVDPLLDRIVGDVRRPLLLLLAAALLVLLIACANVSNLLLTRGAARRRELAVRAALGAGRGRIVRQLLTESMLLAAGGGAAGVALTSAALSAIRGLGPAVFGVRPPELDLRVLAVATVTALGSALLAGLLPALRAAPADPQPALREAGARVAGGSGRTRRLLAAGQLTLAVVLLSAGALVVKSFARVLAVDPGIRTDHVLTMQVTLPGARYDSTRSTLFYRELTERLRALPGVRAVAVTSLIPLGGDFDRVHVPYIAGRPPLSGSDAPTADRYVVSPSYFGTMGVRLLRGRPLADEDRYDSPLAVLVDPVFARRAFGEADPIGQRLRLPGRDGWATVVGVVAHVKTYGLDATSPGQIYLSNAQWPWRWSALAVHTAGDPLALAPTATRIVHELDPDQPVDAIASMDQLLGDSLRARRFTLALLGAFAALATLLALVGLYGVISFGVTLRRREFGVRLALGAGAPQIARIVLGEGTRIAAAGALAGCLGALGAGRIVASLLFDVSPRDPLVLAGVLVGLVVVAFAAALVPALRATRVDVVEVLREE